MSKKREGERKKKDRDTHRERERDAASGTHTRWYMHGSHLRARSPSPLTRSTTLRPSLQSVQRFMRRKLEPSLHRIENLMSLVGCVGADLGAWIDQNSSLSFLTTVAAVSIVGCFVVNQIQLKNR